MKTRIAVTALLTLFAAAPLLAADDTTGTHPEGRGDAVNQKQEQTIASPFFAKPEMGPSDFGSEKLATVIASGGPRSSCVRHGATLRCAPWLPQ